MADIAPFRAIRYDEASAGPIDRVVSPPYDVLSADDQHRLYDADPHNVVRIVLNRAEPGDDPSADSYLRAASCMRDWLAAGILREDPEPALYLYRQEFTHPVSSARLARTGLVCALKLEPYSSGVVLPHEETRRSARDDRLRLMRATRANTEPIFGLYDDPGGGIGGTLREAAGCAAPLADFLWESDRHVLVRIDDGQAICRVQDMLRESRIWIADGHHRYETSLAFRDETGATCPGADRILIVLSAFEDPGLAVLPTHRVVRNMPAERIRTLASRLEAEFVVQPAESTELGVRLVDAEHSGAVRIGVYDGTAAYTISPRSEDAIARFDTSHGSEWRGLDVSILQALVLDRALGIPQSELGTTRDVAYTRDAAEALAMVRSGEFEAAFLLNAPTAHQVRMVAQQGDKMPPKSTYFYPKLWSGVVMRRM